MSAVELRPYQADATHDLRAAVAAGKRRVVLVAPTGAGKSEMAFSMLEEVVRKGTRALFIVDRVVLVDQTSERLDQYGIHHGVIQAGHWRFRSWEKIQVCSVQTLERRGIPEDVQVIFVDEAHCMRAKLTEYLKKTDAIVIGLTATPLAKGMGSVYEAVVNATTTNWLVEQGFLAPLKVYAATAIDTKGMKVVGGEWSEKEIEKRGLTIIGDIVSEWQQKTQLHFGGPVKTIVFSATVTHGEELCRHFRAAGFNFQQISYKDGDDASRKELISEFKNKDSRIHGLVSCEVLTKGFDVPDVQCGISARPYRKSLSSHIQQLGRVMRSSPGKEFGLWLDHSGNYMRFYKDTEEIFGKGVSELDDGKRESQARKEPTQREEAQLKCKCGFILQPRQSKCPACGAERKPLSLVDVAPGRMVEVQSQKKENKRVSWDEKRRFYSGLKWVGDQRGRKAGWAAHAYRARFGVWPNDPQVRHVVPMTPSIDVQAWVKHLDLKYVKRPKTSVQAEARV